MVTHNAKSDLPLNVLCFSIFFVIFGPMCAIADPLDEITHCVLILMLPPLDDATPSKNSKCSVAHDLWGEEGSSGLRRKLDIGKVDFSNLWSST